ncbi:hypothetical protein [Thermococcus barophilus]|uniref:Uncharacterized protein n=1 Tax=Thermococcus barophilus TaxID=55802 RepID=A0A0S1XB02_THEBA|nr:hypothetical protein [Thermococcus barophilus]ALM74932.1 hypothetical protein TBCH5v1_0987 [Thermococcus barophilus]
MLIKEALASVDAIQSPYIRAVTYARIGATLALAKNPLYEQAFKKAFDAAEEIDNPIEILKALLAIAFYLGKAKMKSSKKMFRQLAEDIMILPKKTRDKLFRDLISYMLQLGEIDEAFYYSEYISNEKLKNEILVNILKEYLSTLVGEKIRIIYRIRKIELILDHINKEPYRSYAIAEIIKSYLKIGEYDRAILMIKELKSKYWLKQTVKEVLFYLKHKDLDKKYADRLLTVAIEISDNLGIDINEDLAVIFAINGDIAHSVEALSHVSDKEQKLIEIMKALMERRPGTVIHYLQTLDPKDSEIASKAVLNYLIDNPSPKYSSIARYISEKIESEEVIVKAVQYYLKIGQVVEAARMTSKLKSRKLRSLALGDIAHYLLKNNKIGDALDLVMHVEDPKLSSVLISEILVKVIEDELKKEHRV